jgi:spore coat protein CotH
MKKITLFLTLILSLNTRIFAADGDSIWSANFIHDLHFTFTQTNYWDSLLDSHSNGNYVRCDMVIDGRTLPSVGMKTKGNSSFNHPGNKKSFKVDLNEFVTGQDYDGIKKLNLNNGFKDPTMMREKIMLDFMVRHGITAPRCTYARVYLNGIYWGLYTIVEDAESGKFLKQHYADDDGNLYKGDPNGDLKWYGNNISMYYSRYELSSDTNATCWTDLYNLIDNINNTPSADFYDTLELYLHTWSYLDYMAACNMFVNLDSYIGSGHNYYIYKDSTSQFFHWIGWDVNEAFGNFNMGMTISQMQNMNYDWLGNQNNRPLATKMLADPTYHANYIGTFCTLMQDFSNAAMDGYIDSLANQIRTAVYADTLKFYTNQQFEDNISMDINVPGNPGGPDICGLKNFIGARRNSLMNQLTSYGCWLSLEQQNSSTGELMVFPNPANEKLTILLPDYLNLNAAFQIEIADVAGKTITNYSLVPGANQLAILLQDFTDGIYFVSIVSNEGQVFHSRFEISR